MPQADVGIVASTVFFVIFSFVLGYFVWVNTVFPKLFVTIRVREFIAKIRPLFIVNTLDLPSDELVLLFNYFLISAFLYLVLSNLKINTNFKFEFDSTQLIEKTEQLKKVKYLRNAVLFNFYKKLKIELFEPLFPEVSSIFNSIYSKKTQKKSTKLKKKLKNLKKLIKKGDFLFRLNVKKITKKCKKRLF